MTDVLQPKMAGSGDDPGARKSHSLPCPRTQAAAPEGTKDGVLDPFLSHKQGQDEVDALPDSLRYNWFDLLCTLISIGRELLSAIVINKNTIE